MSIVKILNGEITREDSQIRTKSETWVTRTAYISLDRRIGESVDIMVNGRMIGHGEITVLEEDETRFGVKLTDIIGATKPAGGA